MPGSPNRPQEHHILPFLYATAMLGHASMLRQTSQCLVRKDLSARRFEPHPKLAQPSGAMRGKTQEREGLPAPTKGEYGGRRGVEVGGHLPELL
jgi:hypothetical protein